MNLQKEISLVLSYESSKKDWRNNHQSEQWKKANELSFVVMREGLSKSVNCGCLDDLFYMLKSLNKNQIKTKQKVMNGKFKLKVGTVLMSHGGADILTTDNCTDEKAIKALTNNPALIKKFEVVPEDWKEVCKVEDAGADTDGNGSGDADTTGAGNDTDNDNEGGDEKAELAELVKLGVEALRIAADKVAEDKGVKKAHHNLGEEKLADYILANK